VGTAEDGRGLRWSFFEQMNVDGAEQDCYTGTSVGVVHIVITALP
jgi:hypothetical protein